MGKIAAGSVVALLALTLQIPVMKPVAAQDENSERVPEQAAIPTSDLSCDERPYSILVTVKKVKKSVGTITADLHNDDPERFLKSGAKLARIRVPAQEGETTMCIPVDHAGIYAVVLYHDQDADQKFDKTWIGLPDEPFGVSRDPKIRLSPPDVEDAAFEVNGPLTPMTVTLR